MLYRIYCKLISLTTYNWWLHWLSVGLVIERSLVRLPAGALSSQNRSTQPSILPGSVNRVNALTPACMAGVKAGCVHLCRVAGNLLCDPLWQVTLCSCAMEYFH